MDARLSFTSRSGSNTLAALLFATPLFSLACGPSDQTEQPTKNVNAAELPVRVTTRCINEKQPDDSVITTFTSWIVIRPEDGATERCLISYDAPAIKSKLAEQACIYNAESGLGIWMGLLTPFQYAALTPDRRVIFQYTERGTAVADEITGRGRISPKIEEGIYTINEDGTDLRRLTEPTRVPPFEDTRTISSFGGFVLNKDGSRLLVADFVGETVDDRQDIQILTIDTMTGARIQLTHLPAQPKIPPGAPSTCCPSFAQNQTDVLFFSAPGGPIDGQLLRRAFKVPTGGGEITDITTPVLVERPDGTTEQSFVISSGEPVAVAVRVREKPNFIDRFVPCLDYLLAPLSDSLAGSFDLTPIQWEQEIFISDDGQLLQLTDFGKVDTGFLQPRILPDGRIYFVSTDDNGNCQIFSVDRLGGSIRQHTEIRSNLTSQVGCFSFVFKNGCDGGCYLTPPGMTERGTLAFISNCDLSTEEETGFRRASTFLEIPIDVDGAVPAVLESEPGVVHRTETLLVVEASHLGTGLGTESNVAAIP